MLVELSEEELELIRDLLDEDFTEESKILLDKIEKQQNIEVKIGETLNLKDEVKGQ